MTMIIKRNEKHSTTSVTNSNGKPNDMYKTIIL